MAEGPLILLDLAAGRTFIETGLIAMRDPYDRLFTRQEAIRSHDEWLATIAVHHEWVHFLQSITCAAVHYESQRMLNVSADIIKAAAHDEDTNRLHSEMKAISETLYGRVSDVPVEVIDRGEAVYFFPIPDREQLGMLDLMEGVAVLESFKMCTENAHCQHFLEFLDQTFGNSPTSVYRRSFDWLADAIGPEQAYELLAPVSFNALQTTAPSETFTRIVRRLHNLGEFDYRGIASRNALAEITGEPDASDWLDKFERGEPEEGHLLLDKCITSAVRQLGPKVLRDLGATPSRVTAELFNFLRPPVTVCSGQDSIKYIVPEYAKDGLADQVLVWTAVVGTAERLTTCVESDVYQFCPHHANCPHFESALCHRFFAPPKPARTHDDCAFPGILQKRADLDPNSLWTAIGRAPLSLEELIKEFEDVGEANIWALVRRQRKSILALKGAEGYADIEWKAKATADKTLHALRTQKLADLIEARAFRDAVVCEIRGWATP